MIKEALDGTYYHGATKTQRQKFQVTCSVERCKWETTDEKTQGSTGNIIRHLKSKHGINKGKTEASSTLTLDSYLVERPPAILKPQELLAENILRWIVLEMVPFTCVTKPSFQAIFNDIPGIELPWKSADTVKNRLTNRLEFARSGLKEDLEKTCKTLGISLDLWTSKNQLSILGVVGHWLTEDFKYKECVLEFKELHGSHSGENQAQVIEALLVELGIGPKLLTITGDSASSNDTLCSELYSLLIKRFDIKEGNTQDPQFIRFEGQDSQIRCIAHVLNLICSDILTSLKAGDKKSAQEACSALQAHQPLDPELGALARLRIIVMYIERHPQRRQRWRSECRLLGVSEKVIPYDVSNRWNSTFRMLESGLQATKQINRFIQSEGMRLPVFTVDDWVELRNIFNILSNMTRCVSQTRPQISLSVGLYYQLDDFFQNAEESTGGFINVGEDIRLAVCNAFPKYKKYYNAMDGSDIYYLAMILDPRFKTQLLRSQLDGDSARIVIEAMRDYRR
jgi:hypothetical protein